jgi:predicted nucleic acid-binding Zn ribbon protein
MGKIHKIKCSVCKKNFLSGRVDANTCSNKCRGAKSRKKEKERIANLAGSMREIRFAFERLFERIEKLEKKNE